MSNNNEELREALSSAGALFDGHVTHGSLEAQLAVVIEAVQAAEEAGFQEGADWDSGIGLGIDKPRPDPKVIREQARKDALEEAARKCEALGIGYVWHHCAVAIRALATPNLAALQPSAGPEGEMR